MKNQITESKTFWAGKNKYQDRYELLWKLIPSSGEVKLKDYELECAVEVLRAYSRIYYDIYNNGGCNVVEEQWEEYEFSPYYKPLVKKIDMYLYDGKDLRYDNFERLIYSICVKNYTAQKDYLELEILGETIVKKVFELFTKKSIEKFIN